MLWRAALALALLLLPHTEPRAPLDFGLVPGGVYDTVAHYEPGPIGLLFNMVHAFLHVVQPNPFPEGSLIRHEKVQLGLRSVLKLLWQIAISFKVQSGITRQGWQRLADLVIRVAKDKFGAVKSEYQKVIYYEIGFVVCAALGLLFAVLLPLVGLLFCMCRCCDNCGGEMHQRQRKNADCQRGLLTTLLLTTTFIITCSGFLPQSNEMQSHEMEMLNPPQMAGVLCAYAANQHLSSQLKTMRRLQIDYLISQYGTAKEQVLCDLDMMRDTKEALENVSVTLETLQEGTGKLQFNLSVVRAGLSNALNDLACADNLSPTAQICHSIRSSLAQIEISANYTRLPDVTDQLTNVNEVLKTDLSLSVQRGILAFNDTPTMVTDQTRNVVEGVRGLLDSIGSNITSFSKRFPVQSSLNNFTAFISHTHSRIEDTYPEIDQMDFYRWICCITLCCMVVLILAFNFLGLLCGILGFDRHASPTTRGCVSNTGGNLLMAGAGFSFLFSWVLMGVVTATFVVGGNLEKLVLDTPHLVNPTWRNFIPGYLYNDPEMDLTVENLYSNCKENRGIYSALHLDKVFNVSALLNTSMYTKDVAQRFEGMKVDLRSVILLDSEGKENLVSFTETGIGEINFAAYLEELNKGVTRVDLLSFASNLDAQADQLNTLNQSIRFLERTSSDLSNKVSEVLAAVDAAQYLISQNATFIVNQETEKYKQILVGYFRQYIDWIRTSLEMEVATCKPLSNIMDTAEILACSFLLDSMNTFWFGLGCSTLFLLPSIILSVRLAKFYRRMDTEDVYDDMEIGNNGYYNEHLQGIQNPVMTSSIGTWN
ncbi:hypothetical protein NFI96_001948 [Prochilodus magdalenae]|nr:hypothetical protein NFI96_001948 [Prochilodus magdalenae]